MTINIQKIKNGDHDEFETFITLYKVPAFAFAVKLVKNTSLAEEIVQDSFVKIYVYRDRIDLHKSLKSYLFKIIHNKAIDYQRKETSTKKLIQNLFRKNVDIDSPEKILLQKENSKELEDMMSKLDSIKRKVLYLYAYQNMSYSEISETLGISLSKTKIVLYRARMELKEKWRKEHE